MKLEYQVIDHGVDGSSYFPGCGVAFTRYTDVATGIGESTFLAGTDAFDGAEIPTNVDASELIREVASLSSKADAHEECEREWRDHANGPGAPFIDFESWHEGCELWHFVSIRWRVVDSAEVQP